MEGAELMTGQKMKAAHWVRDGAINEDAGDVGGDIQVGPAISVRFRSDDCPEARFEITVYATAKQYMDLDEADPDCPHTEPPGWQCKNGWQYLHEPGAGSRCVCYLPDEHLACSFKPGTVDLQAQFEYRRNGTTDENGYYESDDADHVTYEWVGSDIGYARNGKTLTEEVAYATADALAYVQNWLVHVNQWLHWDGRAEVKD